VDAGKSYNAALSAAQILAREHDTLRERLVELHDDLQADVATTSRTLHEGGTPGMQRWRDG
jgi:5-(carboxyamino)imidazole ribonucleotide mutase